MNLNNLSMGLWVRAAESLAKRVRDLLAPGVDSAPDTESFADWFSDRELVTPRVCSNPAVVQIFAEANPRRNDGTAHRFVTSEMTHAEASLFFGVAREVSGSGR